MYDIYFDKVLLPVAPSKIKTEISNQNKTISLINDGEINLLKSAGLTKVSFELLLPNVRYPFAKYIDGFKDASYYLGLLEGYKSGKKPFQFIVCRTMPNGDVSFYTNLQVAVENYEIEDNVSDGFDTKVNVVLKQYKSFGTKTTDISAYVQKPSSVPAREATKNYAGMKYKIVSGDTLWNIAKRYMGDGNKWKVLYEANKTAIEKAAWEHDKGSSSNGQILIPGTVIIIPDANATVAQFKQKEVDYTKGGSKTNPPFTILNSSYGVVKVGIKSWNEAYGYYMANGKTLGWHIVDANKRMVEL